MKRTVIFTTIFLTEENTVFGCDFKLMSNQFLKNLHFTEEQ